MILSSFPDRVTSPTSVCGDIMNTLLSNDTAIFTYTSPNLTVQTNDLTLVGQKTVIVFESTLMSYPSIKSQYSVTV